MVFPPTYLPGGLLSGVPATEPTEVVRLSQIQGSSQPSTAPAIPARIYSNMASVGNASTGSESLKTFTCGFTPVTGDTFEVHIFGKTAGNGNNKVYSLTSSVGFTLTTGTVTYNAAFFDIWATISRTAGNVPYCGGHILTDAQAVIAKTEALVTFPALTISATVQGAAANDVLIFGMTVDYFPALV